MPYVYPDITPGINVEKTRLLNSAGYSASSGVRFFQGLLQKCGGFKHLNSTLLIGTTTGLHAWADNFGNPYIAAGTEQWLEIFASGVNYNITPIRQIDNVAPAFNTQVGQTAVSVTDPSNNSFAGDWINITVPVSVGGIIIQGDYQIASITTANTYVINAASPATSTQTSAGAVPQFTTTSTSSSVNVFFPNHGLATGGIFYVQVPTTGGGVTISGPYPVTVLNANTFSITLSSPATSNATFSENGGQVQIQYQIYTGLTSAGTVVASGYGEGPYGLGPYGISTGATYPVPLRQWFLDNFGQDLIANYTDSPLYLWTPPPSLGNIAITIDTTNFPGATDPPRQVNVSFVSAPQEMIICLGCDDRVTGAFDPKLVRWCTVGDFTQWAPTSANQAGSYSIPSGSRLVGGISAPNFVVLWTDIDMWLMSYLGGTGLAQLVWGFNKIGTGVDLLSARACGVYRNLVLWASSNGFYAFDGSSMRSIPCPVWDIFWFNLNRAQVDKVSCQVNSWFGEVSWAFPSATGDGECDSRVTLNVDDGSWTYDIPTLSPTTPSIWARTAWIDDNVYGAPIGADRNGYLQQHEVTNDADGQALTVSATTGWFAVSDGSDFTTIERLEGDLEISGGTEQIQITVFVQTYPTGPITTYGPYSWALGSGPPFSIVRARGRFASIQYSSSGLGVFWRLGRMRYRTQQTGKR